MTTLVVIAKEPLPGKAKTRLHPPLSLEQAADLAAAAIDDTLRAMRTVRATRRILLFEGNALPLGSEPYDVIEQISGTLDARLGAVFDLCDGPTILIGMDTPQVTAHDLAPAFEDWPDDTDAWFGLASDGGYWALGMREPRGDLIRGIPMSRDDTGIRQLDRLAGAGLSIGILPMLTDVDTIGDAREVAALAPDTAFARALDRALAADVVR
jgi:glycosyltransferase A (GT-A) superfamily protein (DUF2064 family)